MIELDTEWLHRMYLYLHCSAVQLLVLCVAQCLLVVVSPLYTADAAGTNPSLPYTDTVVTHNSLLAYVFALSLCSRKQTG